jgi:midasin
LFQIIDLLRFFRVLLDEINLASSETLQRLCGLLDDSTGSVTLTERGDADALKRHPDFRLFAAMNPATDAGKKDLPPSFRSRFSELFVDELIDAVELRTVASQYLQGVVAAHHTPLEHTETIGCAVDIYLRCRDLAEQQLVDASGHKPRYTMRTMCRALSATRNLVVQRRMSVNRSLLEGFELAFEGALDSPSTKTVQHVLRSYLGKELPRSDRDHPPRRPGGRDGKERYALIKPFWLVAGPLDQVDWSEGANPGTPKFILTESMSTNLRRLARVVAAGPWPVLLEGPTSAGKTTLVEYLAARCGHKVVRINNHEHTGTLLTTSK